MTASPMAEHRMLCDLEGRWVGKGELMISPWAEAASFEGAWTFRLDRPGLNLVHDYSERRSSGVEFDGHGVMTVDPDTRETLWFWFDGYGFPPLSPSRGQWLDGVLVLRKTTVRGSNMTVFAVAGGQLVYRILTCPPGEETFKPMLRGLFERAG